MQFYGPFYADLHVNLIDKQCWVNALYSCLSNDCKYYKGTTLIAAWGWNTSVNSSSTSNNTNNNIYSDKGAWKYADNCVIRPKSSSMTGRRLLTYVLDLQEIEVGRTIMNYKSVVSIASNWEHHGFESKIYCYSAEADSIRCHQIACFRVTGKSYNVGRRKALPGRVKTAQN
jgi:hypothetical protein